MPEPIDYEKKYKELEASIIDREVDRAFLAAGGRHSETPPTPDNPTPSGIARIALQNKLRLVKGLVAVEGADGELKPLSEAIAEMKKPGLGYSHLFEDGQQISTDNIPPGTKTYTAEQARQGKASMEEIASGKAVIVYE